MSSIASRMGKADQKAIVEVPDVIGVLDEAKIKERLSQACAAKGKTEVDCEYILCEQGMREGDEADVMA